MAQLFVPHPSAENEDRLAELGNVSVCLDVDPTDGQS